MANTFYKQYEIKKMDFILTLTTSKC